MKILFLEDRQSEIKLFKSILEDAFISFDSLHSQDEKDFIKKINHFLPDVIIAGKSLSKYSIKEALAYLKAQQLMVAFVFVCDDKASEQTRSNIKNGADDSIMRSQIHNLHVIVRNAVKKKNIERKKMKANTIGKVSEKEFHAIFDNQPECIFQIGSKGELMEMNPAALEMTESSSEIKLGKSKLWDFIDENEIKKIKSYHQSIFKGNKKDFTFRFIGNNGTPHLIAIHAIPLVDSDDCVTSILLLGKDISDKKKLLKSKKQTQEKLLFRERSSGSKMEFYLLLQSENLFL